MAGAFITQFDVLRVLQRPPPERPTCPTVVQARHRASGRQVVIKFVHETEFLENEVAVPRVVSSAQNPHAHLSAVLKVHREPGRGVYIVTDFAAGGDLYDAVKRGLICRTELETVQVALHVVAALLALHARHILYADLKLENCVLSSVPGGAAGVMPVVRLIDFGLARRVGAAGRVLADGVIGTAGYIAPEVVRQENVTTQADVWSFGMLLYNMAVCGMMCDRADSKSETCERQLAAAARAQTYAGLSPTLAKLVKDCVAVDPAARPTAVQLGERLERYSRALLLDDGGAFPGAVDHAFRGLARAPTA
jgi:serine/threonine protein kinase